MKCPLAAALAFACGVGLAACGKPDPVPPTHGRATPTPTPKDALDAGANRLETKAVGVFAAMENYFVGQNPKLREKVMRDKAKWREKLRREQKDLQPQIDRLKEQLSKVDTPKNREALRDDLAKLEDESKHADQKLAELEAASQDAWKTFKARLKAEEAKHATPSPTP